LAHELRTPLTTITAFTEILQDDPTEAQRHLGIIHEAADKLDGIIGARLGDRAGRTAPAPVGAVAGASMALRARPVSSALGGRRVLVVDDDRYILEATRTFLLQAGFDARCAAGGEEALLRARTDRPDLILMDLMMPGLAGDEALRRLRSDPATRDIPVIITSGDHAASGLEGAAAILTKPISRETLLDAVVKAMPGGPGGR
jgi:CheY-like chemotaxis protein